MPWILIKQYTFTEKPECPKPKIHHPMLDSIFWGFQKIARYPIKMWMTTGLQLQNRSLLQLQNRKWSKPWIGAQCEGNIEAVEAAVRGHEFRGEGKRMHRLKFFLALALLVLVGSDLISVEAFIIPGFRINCNWKSNCTDFRVAFLVQVIKGR